MRAPPRIERVVLMATATFLLGSVGWAGGLDSIDAGSAAIHPLWLPKKKHPVEERLLGNWPTFFVLDMGIIASPLPVNMQIEAHRETGEYELAFHSPPGTPPKEKILNIMMRGFLVRLQGHLFLDLTRLGARPSRHVVFQVIMDKGIPRLARWDLLFLPEGLAKEIALDKESVAGAGTEQLRQFVAGHAEDKEVFRTAGEDCGKSCIGKLPGDVFPLLPKGTKLVPDLPDQK